MSSGFTTCCSCDRWGSSPIAPRDDPQRRWELTCDQLEMAFEPRRRLFDRVVDVPELQGNPATRFDASAMMPNLTRDVLVHTWDLARAVGADDRLDPQWCEHFYAALPSDASMLSASGMFGAPVALGDRADVQSKLLARLGRNPDWRPPNSRRAVPAAASRRCAR